MIIITISLQIGNVGFIWIFKLIYKLVNTKIYNQFKKKKNINNNN